MKITLIGSVSFARQILETKRKLESSGHEVRTPTNLEEFSAGTVSKLDFDAELELSRRGDVLLNGFKRLEDTDVVIVLNYTKNGEEGYIGTSTLMEIAVAYYLGKQIYLIESVPRLAKCALELELISPKMTDLSEFLVPDAKV